jgi:hypothetical protein
MKKNIVIGVLAVALAASLFFNFESTQDHKQFLTEMAKLDAQNDSLQKEIEVENILIENLELKEEELHYQLDHQKAKVVVVEKEVEVEKNKIDDLAEHQIVEFYNGRYPKDTLTNPLPVAQPVLIAAAKDLVELDGAKKIIAVKDSALTIQDSRLAVKDDIISKYVLKEDKYKTIISNQDIQINGWKGEYNKLELDHKKLKFKNKFTKVAAGVVVGGLVYMMVAQ